MFAFDLYDTDGSGELSASEVTRMLKDIYGKSASTNVLAKRCVAFSSFSCHLFQACGNNSCNVFDLSSNLCFFVSISVANDLKALESSGQLMSVTQFRQFAKSHQALLFPAFQMQLALQLKVLGQGFWERNAQRRIKFSDGQYVSIEKFILGVRCMNILLLATLSLSLGGAYRMNRFLKTVLLCVVSRIWMPSTLWYKTTTSPWPRTPTPAS
jgi:hypothetical protein